MDPSKKLVISTRSLKLPKITMDSFLSNDLMTDAVIKTELNAAIDTAFSNVSRKLLAEEDNTLTKKLVPGFCFANSFSNAVAKGVLVKED